MKILNRVYDVCHPILRGIRGNRWLTKQFFGVNVPKGTLVQFDPATIGIFRTLKSIVTPDDRNILEMGIGQGALISLGIATRKPLRVIGVDCVPERVESSRKVASANGIDAEFLVSDLFSAIDSNRRFDLIVFNPPYVPTQVGQQLRMNERFSEDGDQTWDGGSDGTEVLRRFLAGARPLLSQRGRIVFGVQAVFIPDELVVAAVAHSHLEILRRFRRRLPPSVSYVLRDHSPAD